MNDLKLQETKLLKRKIVLVSDPKEYGEVEVQLHSFLTSTLDESEWIFPCPSHFNPEEQCCELQEVTCTFCRTGWHGE